MRSSLVHLTRVAALLGAAVLSARAMAEPSQLWGEEGELFDPAGRLMDWSYAGYHHGEDPLPDLPIALDVEDFGAVGDGATDDTDAFRAALASAAERGGGVVHVGAGRWAIGDKLTMPDGVVLAGDGPGTTTLFVPTSLTELYGNPGLDAGGQSSYSFSQAFIEARGDVDGEPMASIVAPATRGSTSIEVDVADGLQVGAWIRITQTDVDGALMSRLHAGLLEGGDDNVGDRGTNFHTRIIAIDGTTVTLERALPVDVDPAWAADVRPVVQTRREIGVEHLTVEFPVTTYPGHFDELGYNAIDFHQVAHSWVRDVVILNADYGVNVRDSYFVTVADVVLDTTGDRGALTGHHGLNNGYGSDNLFIGFDVRTTMVHDLTNEWYATGVVFTKGRGDDLRMDHHRAAPYSTLWTGIDCGAGDEPFLSGGSNDRGPHTAAYDTLWNVRAASAMALPPDDFGPRMSFIGFQTEATVASSPYDWWLEAIAPDDVDPPNLWEAMVQRRLGPPATGAGGGGGSSGAGGASSSSDGGATGDGGDAGGDGGATTASTATVTSTTSGPAAPSPAPSSGAPGEPDGTDGSDEGCSCRAGASSPVGSAARGWATLALALLMGARRASAKAARPRRGA